MEGTSPFAVEVFDTTFKCKDCGGQFHISKQEQESMKGRHMELPKRCPDCRRQRRHLRRHSNASHAALTQAENEGRSVMGKNCYPSQRGDHTTRKPFDTEDFDRVMAKARKVIAEWQQK